MSQLCKSAVFWAVIGWSSLALAADWPAYLRDNRRAGVTEESLTLPLEASWVFESRRGPEPAWPEPAGQDYYHRYHNLRATIAFDRAFQLIGVGDTLYFGSSSEDCVYALDARTGRVRWTFFTEGPIRFAPVFSNGKIYVGSDDGFVYCLAAQSGSLLWKVQAAPQRRLIPGNGRMISLWAIRTGLVVDDGTVYCTAGLFPKQGAYLVALDAEQGTLQYRRAIEVSPQGYLLASHERLYAPTGRTAPAIFKRADGRLEGTLPSAGGAYALLVDDVLVTGPGRGAKQLNANDTQTKDSIATFGGLRMLVKDDMAYMQSESELTAFQRGRYLKLSRQINRLSKELGTCRAELKKIKTPTPRADELRAEITRLTTEINRRKVQQKACYLWTAPCDCSDAMILAGATLFVGGADKVAAIDCTTGDFQWSAPVQGHACGLIVMDGGLYVSTDRGTIHCFRSDSGPERKTAGPKLDANPYPRDELTDRYARAAGYLAGLHRPAQGYCLVLDCGEGRLAYELARRTEYKIVGLESDIRNIRAARDRLAKAGLYGRVAIHHAPEGELPFTSAFANLVTSDGLLRGDGSSYSADEAQRLVRPFGGRAVFARLSDTDGELAWDIRRKGSPGGAGEWTHTYAEPGNGACSGDELVQGPMALQWFGEPGPAEMIDRHHRNVPPLFKDGRLFVPGDCVVYAVDAYNGTILWKASIPDSRRLGVFLDSGNMAVDERFLYVAAGEKCHRFDVQTGREGTPYVAPQSKGNSSKNWGYLAYADSILFGSGCRPGAAYTQTSYDADLELWYRDMKLVTSDYLFAQDKEEGTLLWTYEDGLILNTTIMVDQGRVYFLETHGAEALAEQTGRMPIKALFADRAVALVCLDQRTGDVVFKKQIDVAHFEEPVYLNGADGVLLLSGSRLVDKSVRYHYDAFNAADGSQRWRASHDTGLAIDGGHGEYNRHPTIVGDVVYAWPYAYELDTGKKLEGWQFIRRGHGCGGLSASAQCLFWRGANPWMYDLGPEGGPQSLNSVTRPGCWINMIPAGGLVLVPEASSGCTCGFSLQTSLAYIPVSQLN